MIALRSLPPLDHRLVLLCVAAGVFHVIAITRGSFDLFASEPLGLVYNSMLAHMLQGRFDVDPSVISIEGFVHEGKVYSYFGIFPALLRLVLVPFADLETMPMARLSCLAAMLLGLSAQVRAVLWATGGKTDGVAAPMLLAVLFSGPSVYLGSRAIVYHESILWAWAMASVFIAYGMKAILADGAERRAFTVMAAAAAICVNTRVSTAVGLYAGLGLLLALMAWRDWRRGERLHVIGATLLPAATVLAAGLAIALLINYARWGDALSFADLGKQTLLRNYAQNQDIVREYGTFSLRRLGLALNYYVLPYWAVIMDGRFLLQESLARAVWTAEAPPASILLTDPFLLLLSGIGIASLARTPAIIDRPSVVAIGLGMTVPIVLILTFIYFGFRYRAEFQPLLLLLSCVALHGVTRQAFPRPVAPAVIWGSMVLQLVATQFFNLLYRASPLGQPDGVLASGWVETYRQVLERQGLF